MFYDLNKLKDIKIKKNIFYYMFLKYDVMSTLLNFFTQNAQYVPLRDNNKS